LLGERLGIDADAVHWLRQIHGAEVEVVTSRRDSTTPVEPPIADAAVTAADAAVLAVMTADCAPIALVAGRAVAVVHAGWPGLLAGVVGAAVDALRLLADGPVSAFLGPCVHPEHYEFGAQDLQPFVDRFGPSVESRTAWDTPAFDLPEAVHLTLREQGVERVETVDICTFGSADHFSYRRDGTTGRQALFAWIEP
ncbi:MAG TPA: laccase domain-containing protein, partial [Acidimicrobiia bacterium]|nr:laccase domain-containing protein [Acidimicrobiia bacterium]